MPLKIKNDNDIKNKISETTKVVGVDLPVIPPKNSFILGDCMDYLKLFPPNFFDLAIVDPPYGINYAEVKHPDRPTEKWQKPNSTEYKNFDDDSPPDQDYFDELFRISKNQIIWGGNNFNNLPASGIKIIWDKKVDEKERLSMAELAWSSFNKKIMIFRYLWAGFKKQEQVKRIHPTQKPEALYRWILRNYAKAGDLILDTHVGSASSLIACTELGFDYIGFEKDEEYYTMAKSRLGRATRKYELFEAV